MYVESSAQTKQILLWWTCLYAQPIAQCTAGLRGGRALSHAATRANNAERGTYGSMLKLVALSARHPSTKGNVRTLRLSHARAQLPSDRGHHGALALHNQVHVERTRAHARSKGRRGRTSCAVTRRRIRNAACHTRLLTVSKAHGRHGAADALTVVFRESRHAQGRRQRHRPMVASHANETSKLVHANRLMNAAVRQCTAAGNRGARVQSHARMITSKRCSRGFASYSSRVSQVTSARSSRTQRRTLRLHAPNTARSRTGMNGRRAI